MRDRAKEEFLTEKTCENYIYNWVKRSLAAKAKSRRN